MEPYELADGERQAMLDRMAQAVEQWKLDPDEPDLIDLARRLNTAAVRAKYRMG